MQIIFGSRAWLAVGVMMCLANACHAQAPDLPKPSKAHELLSQFAGEWDVVAEASAFPGGEPLKCQGTESAKMVGGFWLVGDSESTMMGTQVRSLLTLGYNPEKKKYVGTFICSAGSQLWEYEGTMDDSGKKLTLLTEGPSPLDPSKIEKYREVLELKDDNQKVFTSYTQADDGKWQKFMVITYTRKKAE